MCASLALTACGQDNSLPSGVKPSDLPNGNGFLPTQAALNSTTRGIFLGRVSLHVAIAWSPDGKKFAISNPTRNGSDPLATKNFGNNYINYGITQIYDAQTLTPLFEFNELSTNLRWSADGRELMGGAFSIWDTVTGQRLIHWDALHQFAFDPNPNAGAYGDTPGEIIKVIPSPDGQYVATIATKNYYNAYTGSVKLNISSARTGISIREVNLSNRAVFFYEGYNFIPTFFQWNSTGNRYAINTVMGCYRMI